MDLEESVQAPKIEEILESVEKEDETKKEQEQGVKKSEEKNKND